VLRVFDRLADTPAEILTELGQTLRQTPLAAALIGDTTGYAGPARSIFYRWFTLPTTRELYAPEDHLFLSRMFASSLRSVLSLRGPGSQAAQLADLLARSKEFRATPGKDEARLHPRELKRFIHHRVGRLELTCQTLLDPAQSHSLQVYTAIPGTESYEKLQLLSVIGA
jgi:hypothetical protein